VADILIVDDDADLAAGLADLLELAGHRVRVASDGRAGIDALEERLPDLLVLDIEMPVLDGPGMANEMLVHDCGRENVPILLSSGYFELARIAARVGTPYSVGKPCSIAQFMAVLGRAIVEHQPPQPPPLA
jgi:CheY-like chemotaxis protein